MAKKIIQWVIFMGTVGISLFLLLIGFPLQLNRDFGFHWYHWLAGIGMLGMIIIVVLIITWAMDGVLGKDKNG